MHASSSFGDGITMSFNVNRAISQYQQNVLL